jgi:hypothetical protein
MTAVHAAAVLVIYQAHSPGLLEAEATEPLARQDAGEVGMPATLNRCEWDAISITCSYCMTL